MTGAGCGPGQSLCTAQNHGLSGKKKHPGPEDTTSFIERNQGPMGRGGRESAPRLYALQCYSDGQGGGGQTGLWDAVEEGGYKERLFEQFTLDASRPTLKERWGESTDAYIFMLLPGVPRPPRRISKWRRPGRGTLPYHHGANGDVVPRAMGWNGVRALWSGSSSGIAVPRTGRKSVMDTIRVIPSG